MGRPNWSQPSRGKGSGRLQQQRPQRGGGPPHRSNVPDDRLHGWSDDAYSPVTKVSSMQRGAAPEKRFGVRKAIQKNPRSAPLTKGRGFASRVAKGRGSDMAPAATQVAFEDQVGDDSAYSASGLFGPMNKRGKGRAWRPKGVGKGYKGGWRSGGKGYSRGGKGKGKGRGKGNGKSYGRKGKGRGKKRW